ECLPIHADRLVSDLVKVLDRNATVILDSFTLSGYLSHWFTARYPGQVVDAGPLAPVGHSIGMAIGVQLARPGQQVVAVIGDGGLGIGGLGLGTGGEDKLPRGAGAGDHSPWGAGVGHEARLKGRP